MKFTFKKQPSTGKLKVKKSSGNIFSYKHIYIVVYLAGAVALSYMAYFTYQNYYQTITQAEEIAVLRQEVAPDTIDIKKVNQVLEALEKKSTTTAAVISTDIKNPFDPLGTASQVETPLSTNTQTTSAPAN